MESMEICWWILFSANFILYGVTCVMIIKRKRYTSISMRSPTLSLMTILGNFFLSQIIILYEIFDKNIISFFYYFFRVMMVVSLILRYERILKCCKIYKNSEREDEKYFSKKRYLYQEKYYFKILLICLLSIFVLMLILFLIKFNNVEVFFRFNLIYDFKQAEDIDSIDTIYKMNLIVWICWNFVEEFIIIFYIFRTLSQYLKEKLKLEILISFIIWYIYAFICTILNITLKPDLIDKDSNINIILVLFSLLVHYALLFFNGIFPLILSYHYRTSISYHFSPKLMGNLYLFLINEECYNTFYDYLKKYNDTRGLFYLKLYTYIMKYKLNFAMNVDDKVEARNDLDEIYNLYFADENLYSNYIDKTIIIKIREDYKGLEDRIIPEIFDRALKVAFAELGKIFEIFHNKDEYSNLYYKIKKYSYIHCKMCNTGLINQM